MLIKSSVDLSDEVYEHDGTNPIIIEAENASIKLPKVVNTGDHQTGIGVIVKDTSHCKIEVSSISNFGTGLLLVSECTVSPRMGNGTVHNTLELRHLENNKVNLEMRAENDGWVNQNVFIGGSFSHYSNNPIDSEDYCHIKMINNSTMPPIDNNTFIGTSLEWCSAKYIIDGVGKHNVFMNCRWEKPKRLDGKKISHPTIRFTEGSGKNCIFGGYHVERLKVVQPWAASYITGVHWKDRLRRWFNVSFSK